MNKKYQRIYVEEKIWWQMFVLVDMKTEGKICRNRILRHQIHKHIDTRQKISHATLFSHSTSILPKKKCNREFAREKVVGKLKLKGKDLLK